MTGPVTQDGTPLPSGVVDAAVRNAPGDIPGVLACLREIQSALKEGPSGEGVDSLRDLHRMTDGLACFNHLYRVITAEILDKYDAGNFFRDPGFLQELDVQFARRYFNAIATYGQPSRPRSWAVLFDRRADVRITPLQFAAAGVNTHVNFDLPFAVVATCRALGRHMHAPGQHHDYDRVNEVFFIRMARLRHHYEEDWQRRLDRRAIKTITNVIDDILVVLDRMLAWRQAEHLWRTPAGEPLQRTEKILDAVVSATNLALLTPMPPWLRDGLVIRSALSTIAHAGAIISGRLGYRIPPVKRALTT